jgi:hypothetical protein
LLLLLLLLLLLRCCCCSCACYFSCSCCLTDGHILSVVTLVAKHQGNYRCKVSVETPSGWRNMGRILGRLAEHRWNVLNWLREIWPNITFDVETPWFPVDTPLSHFNMVFMQWVGYAFKWTGSLCECVYAVNLYMWNVLDLVFLHRHTWFISRVLLLEPLQLSDAWCFCLPTYMFRYVQGSVHKISWNWWTGGYMFRDSHVSVHGRIADAN